MTKGRGKRSSEKLKWDDWLYAKQLVGACWRKYRRRVIPGVLGDCDRNWLKLPRLTEIAKNGLKWMRKITFLSKNVQTDWAGQSIFDWKLFLGSESNSPQSPACVMIMSMHSVLIVFCRRTYWLNSNTFSTIFHFASHQLGRNVKSFEECLFGGFWSWRCRRRRKCCRAAHGILNSNSRWLVYFIRGTLFVWNESGEKEQQTIWKGLPNLVEHTKWTCRRRRLYLIWYFYIFRIFTAFACIPWPSQVHRNC